MGRASTAAQRRRRPAAAAEGADFVFSCVGNDDDLRAVALGDDGALAGMETGAIFVDNTTASARRSRASLQAAAQRSAASASSTRRSPAARPGPRTAR